MSRVLKFRAWDKTGLPGPIYGTPPMSPSMSFGSWCKVMGGKDPSDQHWIFMQFTGLLDKNGKEIYEGDVVTVSDKYPCVVDFPQSYSFYEEMPAESLEVIGNIYENPELLPIKRIPADA